MRMKMSKMKYNERMIYDVIDFEDKIVGDPKYNEMHSWLKAKNIAATSFRIIFKDPAQRMAFLIKFAELFKDEPEEDIA